MSTLIKLPNGQRILMSDRARLGCVPQRLGCTTQRFGAVEFNLNTGSAMNAASSGAAGLKAGAVFGPIGAAVGAVVGALSSVLGKKKDRDKEAWKIYKTIAGQTPGRTFEELPFELAYQGMVEKHVKWHEPMEHKIIRDATLNPWKAKRLPQWVAYKVVDAICRGQVLASDSAESIYNKLIAPIMQPYFPADYGAGRQLLVDIVDRTLADKSIGMTYHNKRQNHVKPSDILKQLCGGTLPASTPAPAPLPTPTPNPPSLTPPVATLPVTAPPTTQTPASTPQTSFTSQIESLVKNLLDQGASQQQAFSSALNALNSKGVAITPDVQNQVAQEIQKSGTDYTLPLILAGVGGVALLFLFSQRKRKS